MRILGVVASSSREVPGAPTIGTATDVGTGRAYNNGAATVTFTAPTFDGGLPITSYTVTSSPGGFTGTGASSPVTVTGLQSNTAYTFTVTATNSRGTGAASSASNSITATTVPQAPTVSVTDVGTGRAFNNGAATVTITGGATGGKTITSYAATSSPGSFTASGSSPLTVTGLASNTAYTYSVTATNANGTSAATVSGSVTATTVPQAPTIGTATAGSSSASVAFTANSNGGKTVSTFTATSSPSSITGTGAGSPITVSGLTNGTAYTFTVTATNANGTSTASAASNSVTPAVPNLSSWSNVGTYPVARNYMASTTGGGYLWSSGGNNSGPQVQSYRSTNGASWSSIGNLPAARWIAGGAFDGTRYQHFVGLDSTNNPVTTTYFTTGSSFSTGTDTPLPGQGARGWSIGSAVGVGAYWTPDTNQTNTYYRTGTGAWTQGASLAVSATIDGFSVGNSTNRNDRSVAYGFVPQIGGFGNGGRAYSNSSISGTWSTFGPTVSTITWNRPNIGWVNSYLFIGGGDFNTAVVRGDGSTWSSQTALPAAMSNHGGSGGLGNDWYIWGGDSAPGTFTQAVYKATQN